MPRTIPAVATVATLLASLLDAGRAGAQAPYPQPYPQQYPQQPYPQQYPQQPYPQPPPQQYPQQQFPQQQYPQQPYPQQPYGQPYPPPAYGQPAPYAPAPPSTGQFGEAGQFIISADRLFGISLWSDNLQGDNNASTKNSGTAINLLFGSDFNIAGPYATPRLGLDYTVAKSFTVGGSIGLILRSGSVEESDGTTTQSQDTPSVAGFAFAPRGGYILPINPTISLWFRGGLTFFSFSQKQTIAAQSASQTDSGFALDLEPQLVITPAPHFGFTAGLLGDIPLTGNRHSERSQTNSSTDQTYKITNWGLSLGMFGYL
jgi:hypothetical protein